MRLFVGLALPPEVAQTIAALAGGIPGARWVRLENLHLTLRFIGEVAGGTDADILSALGRVTGSPFELQLDGVGQFGDRRSSQILWAGVRANPELMQLQARVETALQGAGLAPEPRKFHPHVTVARLKAAPKARVHRFLADHAAFGSLPFPIESLILYESHLGRSGADYAPVASFPLS